MYHKILPILVFTMALACQPVAVDKMRGTAVSGLLPLVQVVSSPEMCIPIVLTNASDVIIKYAVESDEKTLYHLDGTLRQHGEIVTKDFKSSDARSFNKNRTRSLSTQESAVLDFRLPYSHLDAGRYELHIVYEIQINSVHEQDYGLSAHKFEQTILINVVDK